MEAPDRGHPDKGRWVECGRGWLWRDCSWCPGEILPCRFQWEEAVLGVWTWQDQEDKSEEEQLQTPSQRADPLLSRMGTQENWILCCFQHLEGSSDSTRSSSLPHWDQLSLDHLNPPIITTLLSYSAQNHNHLLFLKHHTKSKKSQIKLSKVGLS